MKKNSFLCLFMVVAFLATTFSCRQTQSNNAKLIVRFDANVKVMRSNSSVVNTGDEVSEGEELVLSPSKLEDGQFVSSWIINDVALSNSAQGKFVYNVKKSDAKLENSLNVLNITFDTTASEKFILKLSDDVSCKDSLSSMKLVSGNEVTEGRKLDFNAILSDEESCENWYINNVKVQISSPFFQYVVAREDARIEEGVATISISFKKSVSTKLIIKFDDSNIGAIDENKKGIFNGDEVTTSDVITFTASIEAGKVVDSWFVQDVKQENQTSRTFIYSPNEKDAISEGDKKVITIKCEKKDSRKVRIDFNPDDIYTSSGIESGTEVDDGSFILFNSRFTSNSYAPTWYVNGKKQSPQTLGGDSYYDNFIQTFKYTVDIKDAIDEGGVKVINVSYKVPDKNKKLTITFPSNVIVIIEAVGQVQSGYQIDSGETLGIQANYGYEGEGEKSNQKVALDSWYINGKKVGYPKVFINPTIYYTGGSAFAYSCRIDEDDADANNVVNISYTTHERKEISIEFDAPIQAFKGSVSARTPISSGTLIKEDTFLSFRRDTSIDEYFDENFYFNGKKWESILSADLYLLNANDAIEKDGVLVLQVTAKTRPRNMIKVIWDDPNITCEQSGTSLSSGEEVYEGTSLTFKYSVTDANKIIRGFFTDGKDDSHILARNKDTDKIEGCILKTALEYCKKDGDSYVLRPRFMLGDKEKVTITFDPSITCTNKDNNSNIASGTEILEGTTLKFQASAAEVHTWIVGIKEIHGGRLTLPNPSIWSVNKEWAKKKDGKLVANILFE